MRKIELRPIALCDVSRAFIASACSPQDLVPVLDQLDHGAKLCGVFIDESMCAAYILRFDSAGDIREGVIVAAGGRSDVDLTREVLPMIEAQLRAVGCGRVRLHTQREGLKKLAGGLGYGTVEYVMRKDL